EARLLSAGRPDVEGRGAGRYREGFPLGHEHRVFRATRVSGRHARRQTGDSDVINLIDAYPLSEFDGKMKKHDWSKLPHFPQPESGGAETKWVFPETFFDQLPLLLDDATPLAGDEPRYD